MRNIILLIALFVISGCAIFKPLPPSPYITATKLRSYPTEGKCLIVMENGSEVEGPCVCYQKEGIEIPLGGRR